MPAAITPEKAAELIGDVFHRLTIVAYLGSDAYGRIYQCRCVCGALTRAPLASLRIGTKKSCGCLRRGKRATHRKVERPEYGVWQGMKKRCYSPKCAQYHWYGGRGIYICDRWRDSFASFFSDMGERPSPTHYIDRIDVDGPYSPDNCRWATPRESANNTRRNRRVTANGETRTVAEWERLTGVPQRLIVNRLNRGWAAEDALVVARKGFTARLHPQDPATGQFVRTKKG